MQGINDFLTGRQYLQPLLGWLTALSAICFVLSLVLIPWFVGRLPADCFLRLYDKERAGTSPAISTMLVAILRNALGIFLLLAGIVMLFLPGQGLLTILLGILFLSFPGKRKVVHLLVGNPKLQHAMNWIRKKRSQPPFLWPKP
jgi:Putative transmembrane protein (PGPGW)